MWKACLSGLVLLALLAGCAKPAPPLSAAEQTTWSGFLAKYQAPGTVQPSSPEAAAVAALGDKIVPHVEKALGSAWGDPAGKGDFWLIVVLARIGTPRAVSGISRALQHDYPGAVGRDRGTAADALVWLGAAQAAPVLEAAIADHEKRIADKAAAGDLSPGARQAYDEEVSHLQACLGQLQAGQGKRDTRNFPFG